MDSKYQIYTSESLIPGVYDLAFNRVVVKDALHLGVKSSASLQIYSHNIIPVMLSLNKHANKLTQTSFLCFCRLKDCGWQVP